MRMYKCDVVNITHRAKLVPVLCTILHLQPDETKLINEKWMVRTGGLVNMHIIIMMCWDHSNVLSSLLLSRWAGCCRLGRWYPHLPRPRNRTSATMARWTWWWWLRQVRVRPWPAAGRTASGRVWEETCRTTRSLAVASESEEWTFMHNDYSQHTYICII